jgi:two-component system LytT family response regulator
MVSISGSDAMKDFDQQDVSDSYLCDSPISAPGRFITEGFGTSRIRAVIAGPRIADAKDLHPLLKSEGIVILAECRDTELEGVIKKHNPDLVVLDIRADDTTKSHWVNETFDGHRPVVLCVASSAQYAARAFAVRALDFLLRPLDPARFHRAMDRVRWELSKLQHSRMAQHMIHLLQQPRPQEQPEQMVFRVDGRLIFVDLDDIDWIGASANYVRLNAGSESYLVRESIGRLSSRLDRERFVRIHRSVIVNVRKIKELQSCNAGEYIAVLKNGKKLPCSRGFRGELERYISSCIQAANNGR